MNWEEPTLMVRYRLQRRLFQRPLVVAQVPCHYWQPGAVPQFPGGNRSLEELGWRAGWRDATVEDLISHPELRRAFGL